jgi:hypothetical protein
MYLKAIPLMRGSDSFISAPHGIIELESDSSFQVQVVNTTGRCIRIRAGELVGHLFKAVNTLKSANKLSETELCEFTSCTVQLTTLIPSLDTMNSISKIPKCSGVLWSAPENWELWEFWEEVGPSRNRPEFQEQAGAPEVPWNKPLLQCTPECSGGLRRAQESPGVALGSTL